ncbi:MAG: AraC family transcriptional regulator [Bacteroidales bacterium]|nr:AraC family transcriptional regulator [Bacteroidales bacterium]MBN2762499.1 AraC family transcriptional regulator [Bacteroidales bacterium]
MENYFKYLTHSREDEAWGLYLTVAGCARVVPGADYPPPGHPTGYDFSWDKGRVLHEYQVNYITEGKGTLELRSGSFIINEGSVILIRPDQWHRYKPMKETGWKEHYIGFNGNFTRHFFAGNGFETSQSVFHIGFQDKIMQSLYDVITLVKDERPGYQQVCAGLIIHILGLMLFLKKNENYNSGGVENTIQKACLIIRERLNQNLNVESLARELDVGYSLFRKAFKKYTGLSPVQYHLSLRLKQANYLLSNTSMSIKEIAFRLGFCSVYYFSKLFKEKTGMTPGEFRNLSSRA